MNDTIILLSIPHSTFHVTLLRNLKIDRKNKINVFENSSFQKENKVATRGNEIFFFFLLRKKVSSFFSKLRTF